MSTRLWSIASCGGASQIYDYERQGTLLPDIDRCACGRPSGFTGAHYPSLAPWHPAIAELVRSAAKGRKQISLEEFQRMRAEIIALTGQDRWLPPSSWCGYLSLEITEVSSRLRRHIGAIAELDMLECSASLLFNERALSVMAAAGYTFSTAPAAISAFGQPITGFHTVELEPVDVMAHRTLAEWTVTGSCPVCGNKSYTNPRKLAPGTFYYDARKVPASRGMFRPRGTLHNLCTAEFKAVIEKARLRGIHFDENGFVE